MTITKPDGVIEYEFSDAYRAPGQKGQGVNTVALWYRIDNGEWIRWSGRSQATFLQCVNDSATIKEFYERQNISSRF
jgi:hypothetical protein